MVGAAGGSSSRSSCSRRSTAGFRKDDVDVGAVTVLGVIGLVVIIIATIAQRTAVRPAWAAQ